MGLYITLHALDRRRTGCRTNRYNNPGDPARVRLNVSYPPQPYLNVCYPPKPDSVNNCCCSGIFVSSAKKTQRKALLQAYQEECLSERNRANEQHAVAMQRWNDECESRRNRAEQDRDAAMQEWNAAITDADYVLIGNLLVLLQDQGRRGTVSTSIQRAIGSLQTGEQLSRQLQYANRQANDRASDLALRYLREAARKQFQG